METPQESVIGNMQEPPKEIQKDNFVKEGLFDIQEGGDEEIVDSQYTKKIHDFLSGDFESHGFNDALVNPEKDYREYNIKILKRNYLILLDQAEHAFKDHLKEIGSYILTCDESGLEETKRRLETRRASITERLEFVLNQKTGINDETGMASRITLSYEKGFLHGIAVLIQSKILNKHL